jgi:hypothetical protein
MVLRNARLFQRHEHLLQVTRLGSHGSEILVERCYGCDLIRDSN